MARTVVHLQSVRSKIGCYFFVAGENAVDEAEEVEVDDSGISGERLVMKGRMSSLRR